MCGPNFAANDLAAQAARDTGEDGRRRRLLHASLDTGRTAGASPCPLIAAPWLGVSRECAGRPFPAELYGLGVYTAVFERSCAGFFSGRPFATEGRFARGKRARGFTPSHVTLSPVSCLRPS